LAGEPALATPATDRYTVTDALLPKPFKFDELIANIRQRLPH
jgi:hypothetical protein